MDVTCVVNISLSCPTLKHTRESTLERSRMSVPCVENTSLVYPILKPTREPTQEKDQYKSFSRLHS